MSQSIVALKTEEIALKADIITSLVLDGDMSRLKPEQKVMYYNYRCQTLGLDPASKPFDIVRLNGKEILYANKGCTDSLCINHKISRTIVSREKLGDIYVVTARATDLTGRSDESTGVVSIANLKGEPLANAMMKAETKAKRRAALSLRGVGMMDETEVASVPNATPIKWDQYNEKPSIYPPRSTATLDTTARSASYVAFSDASVTSRHTGPQKASDVVESVMQEFADGAVDIDRAEAAAPIFIPTNLCKMISDLHDLADIDLQSLDEDGKYRAHELLMKWVGIFEAKKNPKAEQLREVAIALVNSHAMV